MLHLRTLLLLSLLTGQAAYASPEGEATATSPAPEGVGVGYQLEASIASTYVFRGILQYGRLADPSSQNTATLRFDRLGPGSLSLSMWNATSLANFRENSTASLEFDLGASYTVDFGAGLSASFGYTSFLYPEHAAALPYDAAHELSVTLSWANEWVTPSLMIAAEVARMRGIYASLGASRDVPLGPLVLSPAVSVGVAGYNDYLLSGRSADLHVNDVSASVSLKLPFADVMYAALRMNGAVRATPASIAGDVERLSGLVAVAIGAAN